MNEAIKALKAGDRKSAYRQLRRHLKANPKDVKAWLWMSQATTDRKKQIDALKRVLQLEPNHAKSKAIRRRIRELENSQIQPAPVEPAPPSSSADPDEYPFDDLLAEVRAELQKHMAEKEALRNQSPPSRGLPNQVEQELPHAAQNRALNGTPSAVQVASSDLEAPSSTDLNEEKGQDAVNENGIDLILELKKSIEEKQQNKSKKKAPAPVKSAMKVAAPAVSKTTAPPGAVAKAAKTAVAIEPKASNRKKLVLWMCGVLLLSVIVVVGIVFIIPNLPLSN